MRELALQLVRRTPAALRFAQYHERNRGRKVLFQQALMGGRVRSLDEDLVQLFPCGGAGGQRKLVVKYTALDIEGRLHQVHIALAVGTSNDLVVDIQAVTNRV